MQNRPMIVLCLSHQACYQKDVTYTHWLPGFVSSVMSDSLRTHGLNPTRLLCPWDFSGKLTMSQKLASGRHMTASSGQSEWWMFRTCAFSTQIRIFKVSFESPAFHLFSSCYSKRWAGVTDVTFSLDFFIKMIFLWSTDSCSVVGLISCPVQLFPVQK